MELPVPTELGAGLIIFLLVLAVVWLWREKAALTRMLLEAKADRDRLHAWADQFREQVKTLVEDTAQSEALVYVALDSAQGARSTATPLAFLGYLATLASA